MEDIKICSICKVDYPATSEYFYRRKDRKGGLEYTCKKCRNQYGKKYRNKYRVNNVEKIKDINHEYRQKHKEGIKEYTKKYHEIHKKEISEKNKKWYKDNIKKRKKYMRIYLDVHQEEIRKKHKVYRQKHKKEQNKYLNNLIKTNMQYKITKNLRNRLRILLKLQGAKKSDRIMKLVGCSFDGFKKYIESKFLPGMSWNNYGKNGWHIDHIKPCVMFNLKIPKEQSECFNHRNLQPLWSMDNWAKSSFYKNKLIRRRRNNESLINSQRI